MERRLYEASLSGNITALRDLLMEDPLVLDRIIIDFYETPLHVAAMRGHVNFAIEILRSKPELVSELDSQGFSPLHLASAKKNVDMVEVLLEAEPNVCNETDQEGRTPLHLAAAKNRVEIMKMLIHTQPKAVHVLLSRKETILHLCVKHNRLEALKLLVEHLVGLPSTGEDPVSVNSKDDDGNTILHLAVAKRQMKMMKYLLESNIGVEKNALNNNGFTAQDILTQMPARDLKDREVEDLLRDAGVLKARELHITETNHDNHTVIITTEQHSLMRSKLKKKNHEEYDNWLSNTRNALMVVASLIATMAFQAGLNPAGGVWQDDSKLNSTGTDTVLYLYYLFKLNENGMIGGLQSGTNETNSYLPSDKIQHFLENPPGAVWKDYWKNISIKGAGDTFNPYLVRYAGTSILAYKSKKMYFIYIIGNTVGFFASLSIILLLVSGLQLNRRLFVWILTVIMWVAITSVVITYIVALSTIIPPFYNTGNALSYLDYLWMGTLAFMGILHVIRFISWLLRKLGIPKTIQGFISYLPRKLQTFTNLSG